MESKYSVVKDSRKPTLTDLANFVEDDMTFVNDPTYSREA